MREIQAPTNCPSCSSDLVFINDLLYCHNVSCGSKLQKSIEHFAKVLKIKGLGPSSISKLELGQASEIYGLTEEAIAERLGSEKLATKLYAEITKSRSAPLELVLPAMGIPLIGSSATKKLSCTITNLFELSKDTCEQAGLGPTATQNLLDWYHWDFQEGAFPFDYTFSITSTKSAVSAGTVCISGKLSSYKTKAQATEVLQAHGYTVKSSLTKDCTHLINESGTESAKTKKARESGIQIITNLLDFIGE